MLRRYEYMGRNVSGRRYGRYVGEDMEGYILGGRLLYIWGDIGKIWGGDI